MGSLLEAIKANVAPSSQEVGMTLAAQIEVGVPLTSSMVDEEAVSVDEDVSVAVV